MARKYKPLRPSVSQVNRMTKNPVGSGFVFYNDGEGVQVVEFKTDIETGEMWNLELDEPLSFYCGGDGKDGIVKYKLVVEESDG